MKMLKMLFRGRAGMPATGTGSRIRPREWLLIGLLSASFAAPAATLHEAAATGDLERVQRMALGGADVNERAVRDETPLHVAALAGHGEIVNYLLQRGANIDTRNDSGLTALHAAAYGGHADIVRLLIARGADVDDAANDFRVTPLHLAAEENRIDVVRVLLEHDADPGILEVNGYSALSRAGWREHWNVFDSLLDGGASCQPADKVGEWLHGICISRTDAN